MSEPFSDPAAGLDRLVDQLRVKAGRYQAMQAQAGQVAVTEESTDGLVTVTIDATGNVTDLHISDAVRQMSGEQVAAAVLSTLRTAQSRLPERLREVMAATIGDDQSTIDTIVGNYRAKFPVPPESSPGGGEQDDGWDDRPLMRRQ